MPEAKSPYYSANLSIYEGLVEDGSNPIWDGAVEDKTTLIPGTYPRATLFMFDSLAVEVIVTIDETGFVKDMLGHYISDARQVVAQS